MKREVEALLAHLLEDGDLTEDRASELVRALDAADTGSEIQAELHTEILLREVLAREVDLDRSRERLLAKAVLWEKSRSLRRGQGLRRRVVIWAAAASLAVAAAAVALVWHAGRGDLGTISARGDFGVQPVPGRGPATRTPRRGDRVVAGPGGAHLTLGGYCKLELDNGTEVVVRGGPGEETVQLDVGRMASAVTPGRGSYSVLTPAGELDVRGTEFVTTVEYRKGAGMKARSVVVSVAVLAGVVGFDFGGQTGVLSAGANRVFAAEVSQEAGDGVQSQTKTGVVRKVDLEAKAIVVMVTRELTFTITDKTEVRKGDALVTLADIKAGQTVDVVYSFTPDHSRLASKVTISNAAPASDRGTQPEAPQSQTKTGVVRKVDLEAKAIVVMVTRELTFTITADTEVREHDAPKALADVHVGDTVSVLYSFDPGRNRVASRVVITARGPGDPGGPRE